MGLTFTRVHRLLWDWVFLWFKSWVPLSYVVLFPVLTQMKPTPSYYCALTFGVMQMLCQLLPTDLHLEKKSTSQFVGGIANSAWLTALRKQVYDQVYVTLGIREPTHVKDFPSHLLCYMKVCGSWQQTHAGAERVISVSVCLRNAPYYLNSDCTCIWRSHLISGTKSHGATY